MKKKWYEIVGDLGIDISPVLWFFLSAILIFMGNGFIKDGKTGAGTLFAALGGAAITRVRGSRKNVLPNEKP